MVNLTVLKTENKQGGKKTHLISLLISHLKETGHTRNCDYSIHMNCY